MPINKGFNDPSNNEEIHHNQPSSSFHADNGLSNSSSGTPPRTQVPQHNFIFTKGQFNNAPDQLKIDNDQPISVTESQTKEEKLTVDTLLDKLGSPGRAQILIYVLLCLNVFPVSLNFMAISIYGKQSKASCPKTIEDLDGTKSGCLGMLGSINDSLGFNNCTAESLTNDTSDSYKWALACEEPYKIRLAQSIFFCGVMVGGLFFGVLGDRFGRRPVALVTVYSQAVLGFVLAFSPFYVMFVILKFFQGLMLQGLQTSSTTMVMELPQTKYRTKAGIGVAMLATSCSMVVGLLSYLLPYWSNMQLTISVPTVITVIFLWLLPESFRWLVANQKEDDALKVAQRYADGNKISLPPTIKDDIHVLSQEIAAKNTKTFKGNIIDLVRVPKVRRTSFIMFYGWFTAALVYYGITFSIPTLGGNMSLNFFIVGAMETVSRFIGYFIINKFGRRIPMAICFVLSGILCIASACLNTMQDKSDPVISWSATIMALVGGRVCMGQCFAYILIVTAEVFPTVLRTVSSGACAFWNRVGSTLAPLFLLLNSQLGEATPFIVFGSMAVIAGGLTLFIPETLNVPLPDTIKDAAKDGFDNVALENETVVVENGTREKIRPA